MCVFPYSYLTHLFREGLTSGWPRCCRRCALSYTFVLWRFDLGLTAVYCRRCASSGTFFSVKVWPRVDRVVVVAVLRAAVDRLHPRVLGNRRHQGKKHHLNVMVIALPNRTSFLDGIFAALCTLYYYKFIHTWQVFLKTTFWAIIVLPELSHCPFPFFSLASV